MPFSSPPSPPLKLVGILILFSLISSAILFIFLFLFVSKPLQIRAMKVHPVSAKRTLAILEEENSNSNLMAGGNATKKLRRLPHVFSKVLELPFSSHADVAIQESSDCLRFVAKIEGGGGGDVRAHAVEILPGVTKIVVRRDGGGNGRREAVVELLLEKLEVDVWRFRLPATARPEMARAMVVGGELIVTVPKRGGGGGGIEPEALSGMGRLVIVQ